MELSRLRVPNSAETVEFRHGFKRKRVSVTDYG